MKRLTQIFKSWLLGCGIVAALGGVTPLLAQSAAGLAGDPNTNQDLNDLWNNRDESSSSLFSLINRLQLLNGRSPGDFAAEQDDNFQSAINDFRKKQQEQIQPPSAQPPAPSLSNPAP